MTDSRTETLVRRFANLHTGFTLVDYEWVGLPFFELRLDVLALERHELPVVDEFVLRLANLGVSAVDDLAGLLGLERPLVEGGVLSLLQSDLVDYKPSSEGRAVRLTAQGTAVLEQRTQQVPERTEIRIGYDRLLARFSTRWMGDWGSPHTFKNARERLVPAKQKRRPDVPDLDLGALNTAIRELPAARRKDLDHEVLQVLNVGTRSKYLSALMLVFVADDASTVRASFVIDGHHSPDHDRGFAESDGLARLGIDLADREAIGLERPTLPPELEDLRSRSTDASAIEDQLRVATAALDSALAAAVVDEVADNVAPRPSTRDQLAAREREIEDLRSEIEHLNSERASLPLRPIPTYEHRFLLEDALDRTSNRLLIIAPWLKNGVVDDEFIENLKRLCRQGVEVHIGYGITKDDPDHHENALRLLTDLSNRYANMVLRELGYTHAKILIWDGHLVVTSFNWLSFRGDRSRKYRQEEGTYIGIPEYVDKEYQRHRAAIEAG